MKSVVLRSCNLKQIFVYNGETVGEYVTKELYNKLFITKNSYFSPSERYTRPFPKEKHAC